jgi:hypothetical protein
MHSIHAAAVCRQDDRKSEVRFIHQPDVIEQRVPGWRLI